MQWVCGRSPRPARRRQIATAERGLRDRGVQIDRDVVEVTVEQVDVDVIEESPWADEKSSTYLTVGKLAARLKPFGVKPGRNSTGNTRGYALSWFRDPFARYLQKKSSDRQENDDDQ